ncbi:MAG: biotin transporter BioY [Flavobacteriales bacterium]|nr:biotin transporter BioY [Flavobacteriales bacterium]
MLNDALRLSDSNRIDSLIKIGIATVLLCILSPLNIDIGMEVPLTLQSLLVVFFSVLFGWLNGSVPVLLYLLLGGFGLPVFANYNSGWDLFLGSSGGFLIGFLIAANFVGFLAEMNIMMKNLFALVLLALGQFILLVVGLYWLQGVTNEEFSWGVQLQAFMPGLAMKTAFGGIVFVGLHRTAKRLAHQS